MYESELNDRALQRMPFRLAGRLDDESRETLGSAAARGTWGVLALSLGGAIVRGRVPVTADELDVVRHALRALGEDEQARALEPVPTVSQAEADEYVARWRFTPAVPTGDAVERAAVRGLEQLPGARALLTVWRESPDGSTVRIYVILAEPGEGTDLRLWNSLQSGLMRDTLDGCLLYRAGLLLEAVAEAEPWPAYHRRLMVAAVPVWAAEGVEIDAGRLLADQSEPLEVVELSNDTLFFPGLPDADGVDGSVAAWAVNTGHVLALVRCWAQAKEGGGRRTRAYGLLVGGDADAARIRAGCAEAVRQAAGGPVAIEVIVPAAGLSERHRRFVDEAVVLWQAVPDGT
jgi:hypothetical protein